MVCRRATPIEQIFPRNCSAPRDYASSRSQSSPRNIRVSSPRTKRNLSSSSSGESSSFDSLVRSTRRRSRSPRHRRWSDRHHTRVRSKSSSLGDKQNQSPDRIQLHAGDDEKLDSDSEEQAMEKEQQPSREALSYSDTISNIRSRLGQSICPMPKLKVKKIAASALEYFKDSSEQNVEVS